MKVDGWREGSNKYLYKTKIQPRVCLKVWEWEHDNWSEEKELEELSIVKDEAALEWLDTDRSLIEEILTLIIIMEPYKPAVTSF